MPITFTLADAVDIAGGSLVAAPGSHTVTDVTIDSRKAAPGVLFVALPGTRTHGRQFAADAASRGAVATLMEPPVVPGVPTWLHEHPLDALARLGQWALRQSHARVVGVTGSVGKTSTKLLIRSVLAQAFRSDATPGNYNTVIGLPLALLHMAPQTEWFVAEMAMRGRGQIRELTRIAPPEIAVLTNIGISHLAELGSIEAIAEAKAEILEGMQPHGTAVLNRADERVRALAPRVASGKILWYGTPDADVSVEQVQPEAGAVSFTLVLRGSRYPVRLPWDGAHQAFNAAAAATVGLALGMTAADIVRGLEAVEPDASHFRRISLGRMILLDDTYNAAPSSMGAGLDVLARQTGRRIALLGDMLELGPVEESAHREMGRLAAERADIILAVGTRARWLAEEAEKRGGTVHWWPDAADVESWVTRTAKPGDVLYVKASRAMGLDLLVKRLEAWGGPQ